MPGHPRRRSSGTAADTLAKSVEDASPSNVVNASAAPAGRTPRIRAVEVPTNTQVSPSSVGISPAATPSPYAHS